MWSALNVKARKSRQFFAVVSAGAIFLLLGSVGIVQRITGDRKRFIVVAGTASSGGLKHPQTTYLQSLPLHQRLERGLLDTRG